MFIGIDLGTSGVKSILMDSDGNVIASTSEPMSVERPHPLWSEQSPDLWWRATCHSLKALGDLHSLDRVQAIGLSGQMHAIVLLDQHGNVLRPAILWNDGRCAAECQWLEKQVPESRDITGNIMMPGFSAPKVKWVQNHEPEIFNHTAKVLLPKDYLRFKLTGIFASEMSDAAGTLWLDIKKRDWHQELLAATGLTRAAMPDLYEGTQVTGHLLPEVAKFLGLPCIPVVGGGSDNAAGALGVGITHPGQAMISLGTSGVYFAVSDGVITNPNAALHSFCHALPNTWHTMSVILSAASCLDWVAQLTGFTNVTEMMAELAQRPMQTDIIFLPYLSGERTPHNNPNAKGVFFGMTHETTRYDLVQAVLEGVAFALADGVEALHSTGHIPDDITLIGGGARSHYWRQILADVINRPLTFRQGGEVGPALGAARLAHFAMASNDASMDTIFPKPPVIETSIPDAERHAHYQTKYSQFKLLYQQLKHLC